MSLTPEQNIIMGRILNNELTDYDFCSRVVLNSSSNPQLGKNMDAETLAKIGDRTISGNDNEVISQIARWEIEHSSQDNSQKQIKLFRLSHKSGFSNERVDQTKPEEIEKRREICCTNNRVFKTAAEQCVNSITERPDSLDQYIEGRFVINNNLEYVGEKNKMFGEVSAFSYSTSTAACIYGTDMANPIVYDGYCFEGMRGRKNFATGGASRIEQYFVLTQGGGPILENNQDKWIIKFNEYEIRYIQNTDYGTSTINPVSSWVCFDNRGNPYTIVKLWIHLFFPDGSYVRTVLDRSDSAKFDPTDTSIMSGKPSSMDKYWIYYDYANPQARARSLTFTNVWNSYIYNGRYRPIGGYNPTVIDISSSWNGRLDSDLQKMQVAYQKSSRGAIEWKGGGSRDDI